MIITWWQYQATYIPGFDLDDLMAEGRSDSNGRFELSGNNAEVTTIDPKLNIYHDCNDGWWVSIIVV